MSDVVGPVRARLDFSYDGTDFSGWADQPSLRTVQGALEGALATVLRSAEPVRVVAAGRTDAGVHARAQVAHADIAGAAWARLPGRAARSSEAALESRLNGLLPGDVVIRRVSIAPEGFDARFSALERRYAYRIADPASPRDPLARHFVTNHRRPLDLDALAEASSRLTGLRDFAAFCRAKPGATAIRDLLEFSWERPRDGADAGLLVATLRADAFCHSMVRSLVGAVIAVGDGRRDLAWLDAVARSSTRHPGVTVAPPGGLTLEQVTYPSDDELAARAETTRGRRTLD